MKENESFKELSQRQQKALVAILSSKNMAEAALTAEISEITLWRFLQQPKFQAAYRQARSQVVEQAISILQKATIEAVETLKRNLNCGKPNVEVRTAEIILNQATNAIELLDLKTRIDEIEKDFSYHKEVSNGKTYTQGRTFKTSYS